MKIGQLAFQVNDISRAKIILTDLFGAEFNMQDSMEMAGMFSIEPRGQFSCVPVSLDFDFKILSDLKEFELINSPSNLHWHRMHRPGFLSHIGIYCETQEELDFYIKKIEKYKYPKLQDTISRNHKRKNSDGGDRAYRDVIFASSFDIGFNIKLSLKI